MTKNYSKQFHQCFPGLVQFPIRQVHASLQLTYTAIIRYSSITMSAKTKFVVSALGQKPEQIKQQKTLKL